MSRLGGLSCCKVRFIKNNENHDREPLQENIRKIKNKSHPSSEPTPVSLQASRRNINNRDKGNGSHTRRKSERREQETRVSNRSFTQPKQRPCP